MQYATLIEFIQVSVNQSVPKCAAYKKNTQNYPKQLDITSDYIQSTSPSHKSIGLSSTVPGAPDFGWGPK